MPHSQTSIGYNKKCIGGFLGDPIPNSPNSHHKNCITDNSNVYPFKEIYPFLLSIFIKTKAIEL